MRRRTLIALIAIAILVITFPTDPLWYVLGGNRVRQPASDTGRDLFRGAIGLGCPIALVMRCGETVWV